MAIYWTHLRVAACLPAYSGSPVSWDVALSPLLHNLEYRTR